MKTILSIILSLIIVNFLYGDDSMFYPFLTSLKDFKIQGKVKELKVTDNQTEENYYFDDLGNVIKYELYRQKPSLGIESNYIYKNNLLYEINYIDYFWTNPLTKKYLFIYDNDHKLSEIDYYKNNHLFYKYFFEYGDSYYKVLAQIFYVNKNYKSRYDCYYILKFNNSNLIELSKYSMKDKLLYSELYKYNENNFVFETSIKENYNFKNDVLINEYKYDENKNIVEENLYIKISNKVKRFLYKNIKSYIYY